jgi:subtilisin-like proprotein convertase family protein
MKTAMLIVTLVLTASLAQATLTYDTTLPVTIVDGNVVGVAVQGTVSGVGTVLTSITVGFNITGGFDGNLYAYLVAPNGTVVTLLNHIGTGLGSLAAGFGNGFSLATTGADLYSTAANGTVGQQLTGTFQVTDLSAFNGINANGTWTLFFADTVTGGGNATLNSWTLNITAVPEPVTMALGGFGAMLLALAGVKWAWRKE